MKKRTLVAPESALSSPAEDQVWRFSGGDAPPPSRRMEDHLLETVRKLTAPLDTDGVCDAVLSGVEAVFGATASWILLHDRTRDVLRTQMFRGPGADAYRGAEIPVGADAMAALAFRHKQIAFVPDVNEEHRWVNPDRVRASGLKSILLLPLLAEDTAIGILGVYCPGFCRSRAPTSLQTKRLEIMAAHAAIGLLNAGLYEKSQRDRTRLRALLQERRELRGQVFELKAAAHDSGPFGHFVGESVALRQTLAEIASVAGSDVTVLLVGDTGTGKELAAQALHAQSGRASRACIAINCAALPEHLIESEMFGYERGAFTGAHGRKPGKFELAHRGTLFLDEIGDLPLAAQAKLLRVLQDGHLQRIGGTQDVVVDVRVIAATNYDLSHRVADKAFREDLYYRLNVFPIRLPPLRERLDDLPLLAHHFTLHFAGRMGKRLTGIEEAVVAKLGTYDWPGNVRELQNVLERAVILSAGDVLTADTIRLDASPHVTRDNSAARAPSTTASGAPQARTMADVERAAIADALGAAGWRISGPGGAAALLGLKPTTLHAKMKKLGVRRDESAGPGL